MDMIVEQHCHIDGSLRLETMLEIAGAEGVRLPGTDVPQLRNALRLGGGRSLPEFLSSFRHTVSVMQSARALERISRELVEDAAKDGIRWFEPRFCPLLHMDKGLSMDGVMEAVLSGLRAGTRDHGVACGLIVCSLRNYEPRQTADIFSVAARWQRSGVVAVDLAGDDLNFPGYDHARYFRHARLRGLHVTVHGGEAGPAERVAWALKECRAERIGHGLHAIDDERVLEYMAIRGTGIEVCLTSNLDTGLVPSTSAHPFKRYLDMGLRVSLNTDNRMLSDTTLRKEFERARRAFRLTPAQERQIKLNAIETSFAPDSVKAELKAMLPGA